MKRLKAGRSILPVVTAVINRAAYGKERVVLTRRGKALVAVVPGENGELLRELEDRIDLEDARSAIAEAEEKGYIP
ncbi:MAG: type II toxin-antitoxin system Phd/YefM family antitoxin [Thermomicrobia bacterium]|nr:type II toxin-antitoxin system Phd/YefM family antitoxin [Thermomicrobia bacterium]